MYFPGQVVLPHTCFVLGCSNAGLELEHGHVAGKDFRIKIEEINIKAECCSDDQTGKNLSN